MGDNELSGLLRVSNSDIRMGSWKMLSKVLVKLYRIIGNPLHLLAVPWPVTIRTGTLNRGISWHCKLGIDDLMKTRHATNATYKICSLDSPGRNLIWEQDTDDSRFGL